LKIRFAAALFAGFGGLASFNALAASGYGEVLGGLLLAIGGGVLACPIVELVFGKGGWGKSLAIGIAFAVLDILVFLVLLQVFITGVTTLLPSSSGGPGLLFVIALVPWIIPVARAIALRRS
jgi:hypothetical protein